MITLGIDIGTSSVKVALLDDDDRVVASNSRPQPGHSEQDPQAWWQASCDALDTLKASHPVLLSEVAAIGLSGQMHGATLLDAAGAVAVGAVHAGDAFVTLGPSGVLWATTAHFAPNPARATHAFCHALPHTWHQMDVSLSAASCLVWWAGVCGQNEAAQLAEIDPGAALPNCWFAPYLSGERTPHNDSSVRGGFLGLDAGTPRAAMTLAVLEGVCHAMRDAQDALASAGSTLREADLIGGGARSPVWSQLLTDGLNLPLHGVADNEIGCALGAARLARVAAGETLANPRKPARLRSYSPQPQRAAEFTHRQAQWQRLYPMARNFARATR